MLEQLLSLPCLIHTAVIVQKSLETSALVLETGWTCSCSHFADFLQREKNLETNIKGVKNRFHVMCNPPTQSANICKHQQQQPPDDKKHKVISDHPPCNAIRTQHPGRERSRLNYDLPINGRPAKFRQSFG